MELQVDGKMKKEIKNFDGIYFFIQDLGNLLFSTTRNELFLLRRENQSHFGSSTDKPLERLFRKSSFEITTKTENACKGLGFLQTLRMIKKIS